MRAPPHVLVTGTHRSGTTWIGRVLATAPGCEYVHEPFNPDQQDPLVRLNMDHWFQRMTDTDSDLLAQFEQILARRFRLPQWRGSWNRLAGDWRRYLRARRGSSRLVLKDPIALLSADTIALRCAVAPVVVIRHPAAFVASCKLKKWFFDFRSLRAQPAAVEEFFPEEASRIRDLADTQFRDIVSENAYAWKLLNTAVLQYRERHPEWIYVRHEDLSLNPLPGFRRVFESLRLPWGDHVTRYLEETTRRSDPAITQESTNVSDVVRDSIANITSWKRRLSSAEIARVRDLVGDVGLALYGDQEW